MSIPASEARVLSEKNLKEVCIKTYVGDIDYRIEKAVSKGKLSIRDPQICRRPNGIIEWSISGEELKAVINHYRGLGYGWMEHEGSGYGCANDFSPPWTELTW